MKAIYDILENVLDSSKDMLILVDAECQVIYVNQSMQRMLFDYYGKYLNKGEDYRSILLDEYKDTFSEGFDKVVNGASFSTELERQSEQGVKWYFYQMDPVYNKDGSFYCVKIQASDITERKMAELRVTASNIQLMSVLNTTSDSILFLDKDYRILVVNDMAKERIRHLLKKELQEGDD